MNIMSFGRRSNDNNQALSKQTQSTFNSLSKTYFRQLQDSKKKMTQLSNELFNQSSSAETYQKTFFDKLRQAIDESANQSLDQTRSDLSQRFGGSMNSTFGNDLLSRIERNRLKAIGDAQGEAAFMGYQLAQEEEQSRLRKFQALQNQTSFLSSALHNIQSMREALSRQQPEKRSGSVWSTLSRLAGAAGQFTSFLIK